MRVWCLAFCLSGLLPGAQASCTADDLAWLAGTWVYETPKRRTVEHWLPPAGGMLIGVSRTVAGDAVREFEFIRIAMHEGRLAYLAQPGGRAPATAFAIVECSAERVVFANPAHDYPTRVIYTRHGDDALVARIEGERDGRTLGSEWRYQREAAPGG